MFKKSLAALSFLCFLLAGFNMVRAQSASAFTLWMLNVGQGESALVRTTSGNTILFDGGPDDSVVSEIGSVLPSWEKRIDLLVLSHPHKDHITGLITVLQRFTVGEVWSSGAPYTSSEYQAFLDAIDAKGIPHTFVDTSVKRRLGSASLSVVHPNPGFVGQQPAQPHDATVSLQIQEGATRFFLTGDLNPEHEYDMVRRCALCLDADILQVPHHGSASGLEDSFLAAVSPSTALIPVGVKNFFRHPRQEILAKLEKASILIRRTDLDGRIQVVARGNICTITSQKNEVALRPCGTSPPP